MHLFGLYLDVIRDRYPLYSSATPITALRGASPPALTMLPPSVRGLYSSKFGSEVVQIQNGFFFVNWRRVQDAEYSRYDALLNRFQQDWHDFQEMLATRADLPRAAPSRCFMTYTNHAEQDAFSLQDMMQSWTSGSFPPQAVNISASYILNNNVEAGLTLLPALRVSDNRRVHQLTVEVSKPREADAGLVPLFNELHDAARTLFQASTSEAAQQRWGKEDS